MERRPADSVWQALRLMMVIIGLTTFSLVLLGAALVIGPQRVMSFFSVSRRAPAPPVAVANEMWHSPDPTLLPQNSTGDEIRYGRDLIVHTSVYLGPKGKVMAISNGMNCQNCHLDAGTKAFGNNYSAVASTYPKMRARSGHFESIEKRVNDCFERSLNGSALPEDSREMKAIVAYIKWLGTDVPSGQSPKGAGLLSLPYLNRPANLDRGRILYMEKCALCHGKGGEGVALPDSTAWTYPPLWGLQSYNFGAGLYRLSRLASYIKTNMPLGSTYDQPQLTDEEAWDIAAFVNSQPRPAMDLSADWPDISKKPIDHPFGPFADPFDSNQHKLGPFGPIQAFYNNLAAKK